MDEARTEEVIHGSCVSIDGKGLLILGPSGAGKSTLALALMGYGARLVADDRSRLWREGGAVMADAPAAIRGQIEARGVGILGADPAGPVALAWVVHLGATEDQRLPPRRETTLFGLALPLTRGPLRPGLAEALLQALRGGRIA